MTDRVRKLREQSLNAINFGQYENSYYLCCIFEKEKGKAWMKK